MVKERNDYVVRLGRVDLMVSKENGKFGEGWENIVRLGIGIVVWYG